MKSGRDIPLGVPRLCFCGVFLQLSDSCPSVRSVGDPALKASPADVPEDPSCELRDGSRMMWRPKVLWPRLALQRCNNNNTASKMALGPDPGNMTLG